jgi:tRNA threonylcarbamoyladenosine biosynthesis protein TsaE
MLLGIRVSFSRVTEHVSQSVRETESIAAEVARTLTGGEVIALYGDLGAGKTQFTRGLVKALGGDGHAVSSPTFVLLNVYDTPRGLKVFHLDAYRVHGAEDFEAIGFAELLEQGGVIVVEWPSRVEALLPAGKRINVHLETLSPNSRRVRVERPAAV